MKRLLKNLIGLSKGMAIVGGLFGFFFLLAWLFGPGVGIISMVILLLGAAVAAGNGWIE